MSYQAGRQTRLFFYLIRGVGVPLSLRILVSHKRINVSRKAIDKKSNRRKVLNSKSAERVAVLASQAKKKENHESL